MFDPYIERNPGDLISAGDWNQLQRLIQEDIDKKAKQAVEEIQEVPRAADADKLEGSSKSDIIDEIIKKAVQEIRAKSGYQQIFKVLRVGKEEIIKHDLHLCPLVDVYQLDYFPVICCEDKQTRPMWTTFYLFHSTEKKLRWVPEERNTSKAMVCEIQPEDQPFRILFKDLLDLYKVEYTDDSSLGELENEFWKAFFKAPNDCFDDDQYCHSPWFDRCCREEKSVRDLDRQGGWDDLWFQMRPRKTINYTPLTSTPAPPEAPTQIQVVQYDFDTIGLTLLAQPSLPEDWFTKPGETRDRRTDPPGPIDEQFPKIREEIKLMVLLKV
jgi:hypothetical protein